MINQIARIVPGQGQGKKGGPLTWMCQASKTQPSEEESEAPTPLDRSGAEYPKRGTRHHKQKAEGKVGG